jgi:hypothetical protein
MTSYEIVVPLFRVFQRNDKIMTNRIIAAFPFLLPSNRTNIHNIIHINYRWDGELMLGAVPKERKRNLVWDRKIEIRGDFRGKQKNWYALRLPISSYCGLC